MLEMRLARPHIAAAQRTLVHWHVRAYLPRCRSSLRSVMTYHNGFDPLEVTEEAEGVDEELLAW